MSSIIGIEWRSGMDTVGIIAVQPCEGHWKAYMGVASGFDEWRDANHIRQHGAKLSRREAIAFFPQFEELAYDA